MVTLESDTPYCPNCRYNLTGISERGLCPECGFYYDVELLSHTRPRPFFGFGYLFVPPFVLAISWPLFYFTLFLGACGFIPLVAIACMAWSLHAADYLARWQYAIVLSKTKQGTPAPDPKSFIKTLRRFYFILSLVLILSTWPLFAIFLDILQSMGFRVGWS